MNALNVLNKNNLLKINLFLNIKFNYRKVGNVETCRKCLIKRVVYVTCPILWLSHAQSSKKRDKIRRRSKASRRRKIVVCPSNQKYNSVQPQIKPQ